MVNKYLTIKERILEKAMELWGVEEKENIDPVIEILLDVFSYELANLEQEIKISDAKLLERISKILVQESWSLPSPSHALLRAIPSNKNTNVTRTTLFYFQKITYGDQYVDMFFTPLYTQMLVRGYINCVIKNTSAHFFNNKKQLLLEVPTKGDKKIEDYTLWIGIDIDQEILDKTTHLPIALILRDSDIDSYLNLVAFYDSKGNKMNSSHALDEVETTKEHYFETIIRYYKNYLYNIDLTKEKSKVKITKKFPSYFFEEDIEGFNNNLFWIKIELPVAFNHTELNKLDISMNTFPIVNRKLQYKQHNVHKNGRIAALRTLNEFFLNIETLLDGQGRIYTSVLKNDINNLKGTYSLYFGELEQFDERNAKAVLEKVIQTVREEGSSFSAIGYDLLNAYLEDLNKKLDIIERKVNVGYKNVSNNSKRQYLLTVPYNDSVNLECQFWTTEGHMANGIVTNTLMRQFQANDLIPQTIRLQTDTVGGSVKDDAKVNISNLRYGLLSKDRIVSKEDIIGFVKKSIGKTVKSVEVLPGVSISPHKKAGLVRTTQVKIFLLNESLSTGENKKRLENSLKRELEQKSVHNISYKVSIQ